MVNEQEEKVVPVVEEVAPVDVVDPDLMDLFEPPTPAIEPVIKLPEEEPIPEPIVEAVVEEVVAPVTPVVAEVAPVEVVVPEGMVSQEQYDALMEQLSSVSARVSQESVQIPQTQPLPETVAPTTPAPEQVVQQMPSQAAPYQVQPFVTDETFAQALSSKDAFNQLLTNTVQYAIQNVMTRVPVVTNEIVQQQMSLQAHATAFYQKYDMLNKPALHGFVNLVATELKSANPTYDNTTLFNELGPEVMKRLKMVKKEVVTPEENKQTPALPGKTKASRAVVPNRAVDIDPELADLFD